MKLSNLQTALEKIGQRFRLIRERNTLRDGEFKLILSKHDALMCEFGSIEIPNDVVAVESIRKTMLDGLNSRIKEVTMELRDLGVICDSEDFPVNGPMYRLY